MIRWLVKHASVVLLLVLSVTVFGLVSYIGLPREAAPDVKIPVVLVSTPYIGVSPSDIESLVTIPIENELAGVKDLKKMSSTSAEGVSVVSLEFEPDIEIEDALQRVRDRVNRAKPSLPGDAEEPQVQEISFSDVPILLVTIAGDADQETLKRHAEDVQDIVKRIPGVLDAEISGGLEREFRVEIDPRRLTPYKMSLNDVVDALRNENVNIPGGTVVSGDSNYLLRVPGEFSTGKDLESVAIKRVGDSPVFVRDVAHVVEGFAEVDSYSRMNGRAAVTLSVTKRAGASIIDINDQVKEVVDNASVTWPEGVSYRVLADQSKMIRQMVSDLENNIITSLLLVMAVIIFFMGTRNSLFVAFSIPMSMLMSFVVIEFFGMTLNMIVLFSLILALGMLVDNAIVIVENVYRHMEEGADVVTASITGTQEVALAVAASTATTVAAFFPLVFWTGIMGQFMGYLPKTVIIVLVSSLVVAVAMLPVLTSKLLKKVEGQAVTNDDDTPTNAVMAFYKQTLQLSISNRYLSLGLGALTFVFTMVVYGIFNHGVEFFPATEPDRATIAVEAPDGTDLATTDRIVRRVEAVLAETENVDVYVAETGVSGGGNPMAGAQAQANAARITIDFLPHANDAKSGEKSRVENTDLTITYLRKTLQQIPGASIEVNQEEMGPPVGAAISLQVSGADFHEVGALAQRVKRRVAGVKGTTEVTDDYKVGRPEMRLRIDRAKAKRVGASTGEVANTIRTAVAGTVATTVRDGSDEYDVLVQLDPRFRGSLQDVLDLRVPGRAENKPGTFSVPLSAVASYELAGGNGSIRHVDQNLVVTIGGDVAEGFNENVVRDAVMAEVAAMKKEGEIPPGFDISAGGASDEQAEASAFLARAFGLAIALIAIVLVTQFNNFRLPAIVLASVALSLVGVLWGLLLTGTSFGVIMTGLGVISLAGVVVNNAIVLLDYVEQLRERGMSVDDALVKAGMTRFRPVMLTAITTVLGLVPMAMGWSVDFRSMPGAFYTAATGGGFDGFGRILLIGGSNSQFWGPMAVSVIFGLAFATLLTLVMVPTLYSIFEDIVGWWDGRGSTTKDKGGEPSPPVPAAAKALPLVLLPAAFLWGAEASAGPVTLQDAIRSAENNSVDLALVKEQKVQTDTLRGQSLALVMPKLSLQGTYTINQYEVAFDMAEGFSEFGNAFEDVYTRLGWATEDAFAMGAAGSNAVTPGSALPWSSAAGSAYLANVEERYQNGQISQDEYDAINAAFRGETVETSGGGGDSGGEEIVIQAKQYFAYNASVIQPLFNGRSIPVLFGAIHMMDAADRDLARTRQQIEAGVTKAYYGLLVARQSQALAEKAEASALSHLELAERQVKAGSTDERALVQARLAVSRARRDLQGTLGQVSGAELQFARVTGLDRNVELVEPDPGEAPDNFEQLLTDAQARRPDVEAAELRTQVAEKYLWAKRGEWLPTLDARFTYSWSENTGFQGQNDLWMLVFEANWLLWDGGLRIAQSKEEASKVRQAKLAARKLREDVEIEVHTAWESLERAQRAMDAADDEVSLATRNLELAERALKAGSATWLEVEDARLGMLQAELVRLNARSDRETALTDLRLAAGTL